MAFDLPWLAGTEKAEIGKAEPFEGAVRRSFGEPGTMGALTRDKVLEIVGHGRLDDQIIAEIIGTGATDQELLEAITRLVRGGSVGAETLRPMNRTVSAVYDILAATDEDWEDWERR